MRHRQVHLNSRLICPLNSTASATGTAAAEAVAAAALSKLAIWGDDDRQTDVMTCDMFKWLNYCNNEG
jgi:hypothetical protein